MLAITLVASRIWGAQICGGTAPGVPRLGLLGVDVVLSLPFGGGVGATLYCGWRHVGVWLAFGLYVSLCVPCDIPCGVSCRKKTKIDLMVIFGYYEHMTFLHDASVIIRCFDSETSVFDFRV